MCRGANAAARRVPGAQIWCLLSTCAGLSSTGAEASTPYIQPLRFIKIVVPVADNESEDLKDYLTFMEET